MGEEKRKRKERRRMRERKRREKIRNYYNKKIEVVELCPGKLATATMSPQEDKTNLESVSQGPLYEQPTPEA